MLPRPIMIATLLSASVGVPYVVSQQQGGKAAPNSTAVTSAAPAAGTSTGWPGAASTLHDPFAQPPMPAAVQSAVAPLPTTTRTPPTVRLHPVETVLRFDLTREWVFQNWDRKTTGPTDVGLLAVRVALVSGTELNSIAGSLTYFFNENGGIEHISFRGRTGDATRLVDFMKRTYLVEAVPSPTGEQLYRVMRGSKVHSELRIRPEPVSRSSTPHANIVVELELARPGTNRFLPPRAPSLQLPQVASSSPPTTSEGATAKGTDSSSVSGAVGSYLDKARYATPQEEGQVLWKRWPN